MSRRISVSSLASRLRGFALDSSGAPVVEFALLLPALLAVSFGAVDFTLGMLDYHRLGEASRSAARQAVIDGPIAKLDNLPSVQTITCTKPSSSVTCGGQTILSATNFDRLVTTIRRSIPGATAQNLTVIYKLSGIGDITTPGGIKPLITIRISNVAHEFILLGAIPGVGRAITLPTFETSILGSGYATA